MTHPGAPTASRGRVAFAIAKGVGILVLQAALTVAALFVLAFVIVLATNPPYEDMLSVIGWVFWSALAAILTTAAVVVLGLPIRLVPRLRRWWLANGEFPLAGGAVGVLLVIGAFVVGSPSSVMTDFGQEFTIFVPDGWLLLAGWVLSAFCCAHVLWPRRWTRPVKRR